MKPETAVSTGLNADSGSGFKSKLIASPVGELKLVASQNGLAAVLWGENDKRFKVQTKILGSERHELLDEAKAQIDAYFSHKRKSFDLPLDFIGTEFQKSVWQKLLEIPFGETRTYLDVATEIGNPKAVRAVGAANGKNPISIIAPCHRVIGMSGKLTGFAGGLEAKSYLLDLERPDVKRLALDLLG